MPITDPTTVATWIDLLDHDISDRTVYEQEDPILPGQTIRASVHRWTKHRDPDDDVLISGETKVSGVGGINALQALVRNSFAAFGNFESKVDSGVLRFTVGFVGAQGVADAETGVHFNTQPGTVLVEGGEVLTNLGQNSGYALLYRSSELFFERLLTLARITPSQLGQSVDRDDLAVLLNSQLEIKVGDVIEVRWSQTPELFGEPNNITVYVNPDIEPTPVLVHDFNIDDTEAHRQGGLLGVCAWESGADLGVGGSFIIRFDYRNIVQRRNPLVTVVDGCRQRLVRPWLAAAGLVLLLSCFTAPSAAEITFEPFREFETGTHSPFFVEAADFNGDGSVDLIIEGGSGNPEELTILYGDGTGSFGSPTAVLPGIEPSGTVVGDFNGDGSIDIVYSEFLPHQMVTLANDGKGVFSKSSALATAVYSAIPTRGDFDGDGDSDVIALRASESGDPEQILFVNNGRGAFRLEQGIILSGLGFSIHYDVFDMDGDTDTDVVYGSDGNPDVQVLNNDGFGNFEVGLTYELTDDGKGVQAMAVGDLNGDGLGDVLATIWNGYYTLLQSPCERFNYPSKADLGSLIYMAFVDLGDLNGDSFPDLTTAIASLDFMQGGVAVQQNDGLGNFSYVGHWWTSENPPNTGAHVIADLDLDGDNDIAVLNEGVETIGVLINTTTPETPLMPPCYADANADGTIDPLDAGFVLSQLGCDPCLGNDFCVAADVNRNAAVDPLDAGFVLSRFGDCL